MLSLDLKPNLHAYRESGYDSSELQEFLDAQEHLSFSDFLTMTVDVADTDVLKTFSLEHVMQSDPVEIIQDRKWNHSEAIFPTYKDGIYFVVSMSGFAKDDKTLVDLFRSEWKKFPVESGLDQHQLVAMSPGLNRAYLTLLQEARK